MGRCGAAALVVFALAALALGPQLATGPVQGSDPSLVDGSPGDASQLYHVKRVSELRARIQAHQEAQNALLAELAGSLDRAAAQRPFPQAPAAQPALHSAHGVLHQVRRRLAGACADIKGGVLAAVLSVQPRFVPRAAVGTWDYIGQAAAGLLQRCGLTSRGARAPQEAQGTGSGLEPGATEAGADAVGKTAREAGVRLEAAGKRSFGLPDFCEAAALVRGARLAAASALQGHVDAVRFYLAAVATDSEALARPSMTALRGLVSSGAARLAAAGSLHGRANALRSYLTAASSQAVALMKPYTTAIWGSSSCAAKLDGAAGAPEPATTSAADHALTLLSGKAAAAGKAEYVIDSIPVAAGRNAESAAGEQPGDASAEGKLAWFSTARGSLVGRSACALRQGLEQVWTAAGKWLRSGTLTQPYIPTERLAAAAADAAAAARRRAGATLAHLAAAGMRDATCAPLRAIALWVSTRRAAARAVKRRTMAALHLLGYSPGGGIATLANMAARLALLAAVCVYIVAVQWRIQCDINADIKRLAASNLMYGRSYNVHVQHARRHCLHRRA